MKFETIRLDLVGPIARLTLNRPDVRNAFDERMIAEIHCAIAELGERSDVRAIVLTGEGTAFSAGADIDWMRRMGEAGFDENYQDALGLARMLDALDRCPKPTIARVNGPAIGGGTGLVAACDIAVAVMGAFFSFSEVKIGLVPACIAPYVMRKVGPGHARELFISGRRIDPKEARRVGLVNFVAAEGKLDEVVEGILKQLLSSGPEAISAAKRLVRETPNMSREQYIEWTARMIAELRTSAEGSEGVAAFLGKRKAEWVNK